MLPGPAPTLNKNWSLRAEIVITHEKDSTNLTETHAEQTDEGIRVVCNYTFPDNLENPEGKSGNDPSTNDSERTDKNDHRSKNQTNVYHGNSDKCISSNHPSNFETNKPKDSTIAPKGTIIYAPKSCANFNVSKTISVKGDQNVDETLVIPVIITKSEPEDGKLDGMSSGKVLKKADSGYSSEQFLSPSSSKDLIDLGNNSKQFKSTYNLIISNEFDGKCFRQNVRSEPSCNRSQSLRCQAHRSYNPTSHCTNSKTLRTFGCGDPWCHHVPSSSRFSPLYETCEHDHKNAMHCSRCQLIDDKYRDVASQTLETIDKATSPLEKIPLEHLRTKIDKKNDNGTLFRGSDRRLSSTERSAQNKPVRPNESNKSLYQLLRSPKSSDVNLGARHRPSITDSAEPNSTKPRTVHIDVYCTGSEAEDDTDTSSDENTDDIETSSSKLTVFENQRMRLAHCRVSEDSLLPRAFKSQGIVNQGIDKTELPRKRLSTTTNTSTESDDLQSSIGPATTSSESLSQINPNASWSSLPSSSWSSLPSSSWSSMPVSWSAQSSTSTMPDLEYIPNSKVENINDLDSEVIKGCTSVLDETSYSKNLSDRAKLAKLEELSLMRGNNGGEEAIISKEKDGFSSVWKSPSNERKHLLQKQRIANYLEKRKDISQIKLEKTPTESSIADDSLDEDSHSDNIRFFDDKVDSLKRTDTIKRSEQTKETSLEIIDSNSIRPINTVKKPSIFDNISKNISDSSQPKSLDYYPPKDLNSRGLIARAERFGSILPSLRKFGHHAGPVRNPDCECETCARYLEGGTHRNRAYSVGDVSSSESTWKEQLSLQQRIKLETKNPVFSDF